MARFWMNVERTEYCWNWIGARDPHGYGRWGDGKNGQTQLAHRRAYEFLRGPIPVGLEIDHLCRNTSCVRPEHLQPVTGEVNRSRVVRLPLRETCKRGHREWAWRHDRPNQRRCVACSRLWNATMRVR